MAALFGRDETDHLHVYIEPKRKNLNWKKRSQKKKKKIRHAIQIVVVVHLPYILPKRNWVCMAGTLMSSFYGNYKPN